MSQSLSTDYHIKPTLLLFPAPLQDLLPRDKWAFPSDSAVIVPLNLRCATLEDS